MAGDGDTTISPSSHRERHDVTTSSCSKTLKIDGRRYTLFDPAAFVLPVSGDARWRRLEALPYHRLPYCLRVLYESALRMHVQNGNLREGNDSDDGQDVSRDVLVSNVSKCAQNHGLRFNQDIWLDTLHKLATFNREMQKGEATDEIEAGQSATIYFQPARVLLHDFTALPVLLDMVALRQFLPAGEEAASVDFRCPTDLLIDHCVQLDFAHVQAEVQRSRTQRPQLPLSLPPPPPPPPPPADALFGVAAAAATAAWPPLTLQPPPIVYCLDCVEEAAAVPIFPTPPPTQLKPASTLPPLDNPGLPVLDAICPFHQRVSYWAPSLERQRAADAVKNAERFSFIKHVDRQFDNITVIPPGGNMHNVHLEYLVRGVVVQDGAAKTSMTGEEDTTESSDKTPPLLLSMDSVIGTDAHMATTNGLGILSCTVGTLDAEARMFGHPVCLPLPRVVGCVLTGWLPPFATATDVVLMVTKRLRQFKPAVGAFVEFAGPAVSRLSVVERTTIANMCAEYGAHLAFFPIDAVTINHFRATGQRDSHQIAVLTAYLAATRLMKTADEADAEADDSNSIIYSDTLTIDLTDITPTLTGPLRHSRDKTPIDAVRDEFIRLLTTATPSGGFGLTPRDLVTTMAGTAVVGDHIFEHGSVLLAAITSCSNATNPSVMLRAGLMAEKAVAAGLTVAPHVKTSLAPGSGVVVAYLQESGVMPYMYMLGFEVVGYGCPVCAANCSPANQTDVVGGVSNSNSSDIPSSLLRSGLVCCGVLSGNRNFQGRVETNSLKANYLASPLLVIAYAIAGRITIDFERQPIGYRRPPPSSSSSHADYGRGEPIFLADIWPSDEEVDAVERRRVLPAIFRRAADGIRYDTKWAAITDATSSTATKKKTENVGNDNENIGNFVWDDASTYIQLPRYVERLVSDVVASTTNSARSPPDRVKRHRNKLRGMRCLLKLGDDVASDCISPAGSIVRASPAADYLTRAGLAPRQFNSYGARRGNYEVMVRGTFAHSKLMNLMVNDDFCGNTASSSPDQTSVSGVSDRKQRDARHQQQPKLGPHTIHLPTDVATSVYDAAMRYRRTGTPLYIVAGHNVGRGTPRDWATKGPSLLGIVAVVAVSFDAQFRVNLVRVGILPVQIDVTTYAIMTGREVLDIVIDVDRKETMDKNRCTLVLNSDFDLAGRVAIENAYEWRLYRDGGLLRQAIVQHQVRHEATSD